MQDKIFNITMQILVNIIYYILAIATSLFLGEVFSIHNLWLFFVMSLIITIPFSIPTVLLKRYFKNSEYNDENDRYNRAYHEDIRISKILLQQQVKKLDNHYSGKDVII